MTTITTKPPSNGRYIELPAVPQSGSPVPELMSVYGRKERGPYGDARYRGNCGGYLIRDLLRYCNAQSVLDPMSGSGTCRDVCRELSIACQWMDIHKGSDAADPASYEDCDPVDFVWIHPPYWRMIRYSDDPNCLSNAPTLEVFLNRMQLVQRNCRDALNHNGKIAVLLGGIMDRGRYQPLPQLLIERAMREGLWLACTEIIRLQYNNTSSRQTYSGSIIPGLHDTCLVFERA